MYAARPSEAQQRFDSIVSQQLSAWKVRPLKLKLSATPLCKCYPLLPVAAFWVLLLQLVPRMPAL